LYRTPKAELKKFKRFGGYFNYRAMMAANEVMKKKSFELPPVQSFSNGLNIYFLTGKNYLYQTLFCIQSLKKHSSARFNFVLVDDGTFNTEIIAQIKQQLPGANIVVKADIDKNLQQNLPVEQFPYLHHKRQVYPHIKKLTDVHTIPGNEWKLVLDSDMLFWDTPTELLNWLKDPDKSLHMIDNVQSYGYTVKLMERLANSKIKPLINVGAIGLNSNAIDWQKIEQWVKQLEAEEGATYYLEQALTAMIIGNTETVVLAADDYVVGPKAVSEGVLCHYVDLSKEAYYTSAWKKIIEKELE
jgi:hypothetical protein